MREVADPEQVWEEVGPCTAMLVRLCREERPLSDWDLNGVQGVAGSNPAVPTW